jgi:hypothetical protein
MRCEVYIEVLPILPLQAETRSIDRACTVPSLSRDLINLISSSATVRLAFYDLNLSIQSSLHPVCHNRYNLVAHRTALRHNTIKVTHSKSCHLHNLNTPIMPESILRRSAAPEPGQLEAGQTQPLLSNEDDAGTHFAAEDHRKRFFKTLGAAVAIAVFLGLVFGFGGKELAKRRFKLPGGPG